VKYDKICDVSHQLIEAVVYRIWKIVHFMTVKSVIEVKNLP